MNTFTVSLDMISTPLSCTVPEPACSAMPGTATMATSPGATVKPVLQPVPGMLTVPVAAATPMICTTWACAPEAFCGKPVQNRSPLVWRASGPWAEMAAGRASSSQAQARAIVRPRRPWRAVIALWSTGAL